MFPFFHPTRYSVTLRAAGDGRIVAVREFLSAGVDFVNTAAERSKKTALILAARGGHLEVNVSRRATKKHEAGSRFNVHCLFHGDANVRYRFSKGYA